MEINENNWKVGELVNLPRMEKFLKKSGSTRYERLTGSRYICVREATDNQRGILVKVLGKCLPEYVKVVGGKPFTKDDHEELFEGRRYFSYPYPMAKDVKEVLGILRNNPSLLQYFQNASMHINPNSKFWVSDMAHHLLVLKKPQCYDASSDTLCSITENELAYRITMLYFFKGELV